MFNRTIIAFLMAFAVFFVRCSPHSASSASVSNPNMDDSSGKDRLIPVQVSRAHKGTFNYRISCNGVIRAATTYRELAHTTGIIQLCVAKDGARFQKGETILKLETIPLKLEVQSAQLALSNAKATYQSRLLGYTSLLEGKTTTQVKSIKGKLQVSSGLSQSKLNLKNARWKLKQAVIRAPTTVIAANVEVSAGMQVNPGDPLFTLYTANNMLADMPVLEEDAGRVQIGQKATVRPVGNDSKTYPAVVAGINPVVDKAGMVTVHLTLKETQGLFPGMHASAVIEVPRRKTVIVPKSALVLRSGDRPVVFTVQNDRAKWHYVKPGLDNGQDVEILKGISSGDTVIISNNIQLAHNAPVNIVKRNTSKLE